MEVPMAKPFTDFANARGIKSLFHFTRLDNLDSILKNGLLPKSECVRRKCAVTFNDPYRYDGTDAVCATISFPNYRMFYALRTGNPEVEWVVLKLKRSLLWTAKCAFCTSNAASATVTDIPIEKRSGVSALQKMFEDFEAVDRSELRIPDHYTTNPQAEVLLLDGAPADSITGVYFEKQATMDRYQRKYTDLPAHLNGGYFAGRSDCKYWKT